MVYGCSLYDAFNSSAALELFPKNGWGKCYSIGSQIPTDPRETWFFGHPLPALFIWSEPAISSSKTMGGSSPEALIRDWLSCSERGVTADRQTWQGCLLHFCSLNGFWLHQGDEASVRRSFLLLISLIWSASGLPSGRNKRISMSGCDLKWCDGLSKKKKRVNSSFYGFLEWAITLAVN